MLHVIQMKYWTRVLLQDLLKSRQICIHTIQSHHINSCHISGNVRPKVSSILMSYRQQQLYLKSRKILALNILNRFYSNHSASDQDKFLTTQNAKHTYHQADKLQLDFEKEGDLKQLLENAQKLIDTKDFQVVEINNAKDKIEHLVKHFCHCQCSPDNVFHFLRTNPEILTPSWSSIQKIVSFLEEIGLRRGQLLKALDRHQTLWKSDIGSLRAHLKQLHQLGMGDYLRKIVARWPPILSIPSRQIKQVIEELRNCDFSREEIKTIIADHPQVLKDTTQDIVFKFQYVHFCMGIRDGKDLVHGKIFKFSLDHIRSRHILLERMGIFHTPDKHKVRSAKNPTLCMIMDSSDKRFCSKVACIGIDDLKIFRENLKDELEEMGIVDDINDDDEEGDDTDEYSDSDEDNPKPGYRR